MSLDGCGINDGTGDLRAGLLDGDSLLDRGRYLHFYGDLDCDGLLAFLGFLNIHSDSDRVLIRLGNLDGKLFSVVVVLYVVDVNRLSVGFRDLDDLNRSLHLHLLDGCARASGLAAVAVELALAATSLLVAAARRLLHGHGYGPRLAKDVL